MRRQDLQSADGIALGDGPARILQVYRKTAPTDAVAGYAVGCLWVNTSGSLGSTIWQNAGSVTSSRWINLDSPAGMVALAAATTLSAVTHAGRTMLLNLVGGFTTTLPAASGTGNIYRFIIQTVSTAYLIVAAGTDVYKGSLQVQATGSTPGSACQFLSTANQTITLNASTTGGKNIGDWLQVQDITSGVWQVTGLLTGSGSLATMFS